MGGSPAGRVLVTGGAGFIGSHLVEALVGEGRTVRVVNNLATGHRSNLAHLEGSFEWLEGDLADFEVCAEATRRRGRDPPPARPSPASPGRSSSRSNRTPAGRPRP